MAEVMSSPSVRPDPPQWMIQLGMDRCGHCKAGHCRSCKGAIRVPVSRKCPDGLLRCFCPFCVPAVRCLTCGNQFAQDVNPRTWECLDALTCLGRIDLRKRNNRVWRMIQECKSAAANARRQQRVERMRMQLEVGYEPEDKPANRVPRPTTGSCECCGVPTRGGRFSPGHDARLKSKLKKRSKSGDKTAYKELVERGWA